MADWPACTLWADAPGGFGVAPWLAAAAVAALLLAARLWPVAAVRLLMRALTRSLLWLHVDGRPHVPATGPVVLVCNPVSYLGWLLLLAACPRRLRFVVLAGWPRRGLAGWLFRLCGGIAPDGSDQAAVERALQTAAERLQRGEALCLFTEACRTADGQLISFAQVFAQLTAARTAAVVGVCLHQPGGSLVGMHNGRFVRRWPNEMPSPVWVAFAEPLPPGTPAAVARQAAQELSARAAIARNSTSRPVHRQFVRIAARHPFRRCWIDSTAPGQDMNYARAYVGAVCLMGLLRPLLGGERNIAVWLPPGRGSALANLAIALLGKTSVNLNYTSSPEAVRSALQQCDCKHVLTAKRFTARVDLDAGEGVTPIYLEDLLPRVGRWQKLRALLAVILLPGWFLEHVVLGLGRHTADDIATIIFSSGSTGDPKGVMLTHGNVAANCASMIQATGLAASDRLLGVLPFFHSFGYTVTLWGPLCVGASAVYHADPRQAREIGELCRQHRCTLYLSTATFLRFCLKKCEPADFRSLRILVCGAEKLPPSLAADFGERFGVRPLEGYGCTELSPVVAANLPDQPCAGLTQVFDKVGSVGQPLPGIATRVVHPETYGPLAPGEEGLLVVTGANVMQGYLHRPELTAEVVRDGWYATGDMATIDADGFVTLTGRLARFAKVGGEMVPLERIEEELHDVLGTSERVCAVTCVPDEARGERLVVLYLPAQLEQFGVAVRPWCQRLTGRGLPNLWLPGERDFYSVAELPVLGTGKLNLRGVKELALLRSAEGRR